MKRKSQPLEKPIAGNAIKYESYREAWSRIKFALESEFFLEAITIEESIISDRLMSYLPSLDSPKIPSKKNNGHCPSFNTLIQRWRSECSNDKDSNLNALMNEVDEWRCSRNQVIHAIVKSEPGQPTQQIDSFLEIAEKAARQGKTLAREVSKWCKKANNKKSTAPPSPKNANDAVE